MRKIHYSLLLFLSFLFSLYLYAPSLDYYFFQDDFFEINLARVKNLQEYLSLFLLRGDIVDYRPISQQTFFFLVDKFFGLNPTVLRFIIFIFYFTNGALISKLIFSITKNLAVSVLTSVFWLTSAIHFMSLTWIAAGSYNIIGTFFWLVASLFVLIYLKGRKPFFYILAFLSYLLTLTSYELFVTWPVIFGLYHFYVLKNPLTKSIKLFLPHIIIGLIYIGTRFLFIKIPQITEYQIALNLDSAKAFFWYVLWGFNIPEEFKKQVISKLIILNPIFLAEFWATTAKSFISFLATLTLAIAVPATLWVKKKTSLNLRLIFFFLAFFIFAISPVLILPNHTFAMYLTLPSIGLYTILAYLLVSTQSTLITFSAILIWVFSSVTTVNFYRHNSWMIESQKVAGTFAVQILAEFPSLPPNSVVYYYLPYPWQHQALAQENAIKTIYNDQSLSVYYNMETIQSQLEDLKHRFIYIYTE